MDPFLSFTCQPLKGVGKEKVKGKVLKWDGSISFLGDVDPEKGTLTKDGAVFDIKNVILLFREGAGSTVGSYVVYNLKLYEQAPLAMAMVKADAIITIGCILADIPLMNKVPSDMLDGISSGDEMQLNPGTGEVLVWKGQGNR